MKTHLTLAVVAVAFALLPAVALLTLPVWGAR